VGNLRVSNIGSLRTNQQTYRLDQDLGKRGKVFGRGTYSPLTSVTPNTVSGKFGDIAFTEQATNWAVAHTIALSPSKVHQFSFGRLYAVSNTGGIDAPADVVTGINF